MWSREKSDRARTELKLDDVIAESAKQPPRSPETAETARAEAPAEVKAELSPPSNGKAAEPAATVARDAAPQPSTKGSVLGPTLRFKGDLAADEDLIVQGRVEGSILHSKSLTIGSEGTMIGNIRARRIVIEGKVEGDLYALEGITVRETGQVKGNLFAPRIAILDGARFNGAVDMNNAPAVPNPVVRSVKASSAAGAKESTTAESAELSPGEVDRKLDTKF